MRQLSMSRFHTKLACVFILCVKKLYVIILVFIFSLK